MSSPELVVAEQGETCHSERSEESPYLHLVRQGILERWVSRSKSARPRPPGGRRAALHLPHGTCRRPSSCPSAPPPRSRPCSRIRSNTSAPTARRRDHPRQHLSPLPAPRTRAHPPRGRCAPLHELAAPHAHRLRRLPGLLPRQAPQDHRPTASSFAPTSTAPSTSSRPSTPSKSRSRSAPTS